MALVLCCSFFSSPAFANYNNYDWGNDVTYYKDDILSNYYTGGTLTDWQWFPGTGENDGDYSNDQFCQIYDFDGQKTLVYGTNGAQSCSWWADGPYQNDSLIFVDYYSEMGTVKIDCSNPLNDASCPGYQEAYFSFMCSTNALYDQSCPGYAQAYLELQCTSNALYDQSCPGYNEAYALQMVQEEPADTGAPANDGSDVVDDGVPANDGSDIAEYIEPEPSFVEETFGEGVVEDMGSGLTLDEQFTQQETAPTPIVEAPAPIAVIEEQVDAVEESVAVVEEQSQASSDTETTALEEANELDLDSMSPSEVIGALSKLGILGNSATNGVGDPTGLDNSIEGTGGTISATGQVQTPGGPTGSMGSGNSSTGQAVDDTGMTAADSGMPSNDINFGSSETSNTQAQGNVEINNGFGSLSGTNSAEVGQNGITDLEKQMGTNVNPLFDNPEISGGATAIAGLQEQSYNTLSKRIIRERIQQMVETAKLDTGNNSVEDAEKLVAESIQESIENKMDELMVDADVNQSQIISLMGVNIKFNEYNNRNIPKAEFYGDEDWYKDLEIPQNRSALRNGLAQQILHNKMVDMQYPSENNDTNNYYEDKENE